MYHELQNIGLMGLALFYIMVPYPILASSGSGDMGAVLYDPLVIDIKEAKRFCEEEPHAVKCDILQERLKDKEDKALISTEQNQPENNYNVFNANFQ